MSDDDWPNNDHLLAYVREAYEHERVWKLVAGLSRRLLEERSADTFVRKARGPAARPTQTHAHRHSDPLVGPKPESWEDRIQTLEARIVKQREFLANIEGCRVFEAETERKLVEVLKAIVIHGNGAATSLAKEALDEHEVRRGPRPT